VRDIYRLRLDRARVAVLAACDSASTQDLNEVPLSLATAFIAAGAPAVVATLWPVEDEATADLMVDFYQRLKANTGVAEALRQAQIAAIRRGRVDSMNWSAFQVIGAPQSRL
jgi:CHAT domain-containing protein